MYIQLTNDDADNTQISVSQDHDEPERMDIRLGHHLYVNTSRETAIKITKALIAALKVGREQPCNCGVCIKCLMLQAPPDPYGHSITAKEHDEP